MAKRKLIKAQDQQALFDIPIDGDSLIRHHTLSPTDRLEIEVCRREHNRIGFAVQLCLMRYPGRALTANEMPPKAMLSYIAEQIGANPASFNLYARREETRMNHVAHLLSYLEMRSPTAEDRRVALLSAIETASTTDKGVAIANTIIVTFRERRVLLPAANMIQPMGLAARAIARRRAEAALISDLDPERPLHRTGTSSGPATGPPSDTISICTMVASRDRSSTAGFPINTATSAFCR